MQLVSVVTVLQQQVEQMSALAASNAPVRLSGLESPMDPAVLRTQCDMLAYQLQESAVRLQVDRSNVARALHSLKCQTFCVCVLSRSRTVVVRRAGGAASCAELDGQGNRCRIASIGGEAAWFCCCCFDML